LAAHNGEFSQGISRNVAGLSIQNAPAPITTTRLRVAAAASISPDKGHTIGAAIRP